MTNIGHGQLFCKKKQKKLFSEGKIVSSMYVFFLQSAKEFLKQGSVTAEVFLGLMKVLHKTFMHLSFSD